MPGVTAVFLQELGDGAVGGGALQQLQLAVAAGEEGHLHLLIRYDFGAAGDKAQRLVELAGLLQIGYADSNVIYSCGIHGKTPFLRICGC